MAFNFSTLITDRTAADVQKWETLRNKGFSRMTDAERAEWLADNMKGAYHKGDLNRVSECLNYLHGRLKELNYITYSTTFTAKTNWTATSIPTEADLTYYLKCVSSIREALTQFETTPPTPANVGALSYEEANNIEQILLDVETLINNMLAALFHFGDVYAGDI